MGCTSSCVICFNILSIYKNKETYYVRIDYKNLWSARAALSNTSGAYGKHNTNLSSETPYWSDEI